jgi:LytS/YehU family sensor histidine kinase
MFFLLLVTVSMQDALRNGFRWWEPILWEGSSALITTGWLLLAMRARDYHARYLDRPLTWFAHHLRWLPLLVVTFIPVVYAMRYGVYQLTGRTYHHPPWAFVLVSETVKLTLFTGLWLGILFGLGAYEQWQSQRGRVLELQKALTEAQLARLQAQLRPHFFFNALNTISALMHVDVTRADRLVAGLGDLLHISLRSGEQEMTPLREELRSLQLYAQIMQERFSDRVTLHWDEDPSAADTSVPALLLQPLLENAFRHGVERSTVPVRIDVSVRRAVNSLDVVIRNTGSRLAPDYCEGVGLRNCRERLRIIYGEAAALQVGSEDGVVAARVSIPLAGPVS